MKTVLVTGGTSGIGAGAVRTLLAAGWRVIAAGATEAEAEAFSEDNKSAPGAEALEARALDVTDGEAISALMGSLDSLDGLVNCAGVLYRGEEYDLDIFQKVIDVNLTGTMRACSAAHPLLARTGGAIVNTASMLSFFGGPLVPAYSASKGGVAQLTKALAGRWAVDGVRVNAVAPGWIETRMTDGLRADTSRESAILSRTPMNRWGAPEEVGALIQWLLSEQASFVTGAIYPVDGGYAAV